ncbi:hypothetical protein BDA96_04G300900 [Sorghum bicolor]|uniref:Growth-regulating factor n=1 Tax=Sorghum bicolor TaxID=4558 RepID=A0A921UJS3_SORBI|nr:growth-regulating factor 10 isoform X2 [Sorghum bicolor]KAG0534688.1 hypothetical protein BDA96_04G300900 [Sorghum bicolor]|eukprot:XP_002454479.2 growth-regulating factor 10 isoform X2 [Sorghum bicolor]
MAGWPLPVPPQRHSFYSDDHCAPFAFEERTRRPAVTERATRRREPSRINISTASHFPLTPLLSLLPSPLLSSRLVSSREAARALPPLPSPSLHKSWNPNQTAAGSAAQQHRPVFSEMAEDKETESPQPPAKQPRLSCADTSAGEVTMAASSPLVLGLGLGLGASGVGERDADASPATATATATATPKRPSALTFMQQQELEHQVLIYRYFAAGAPVPVHLVLPIWKSVAASSFGPQRFPSLMGLGSLCFDYRSSMEPEPGRCRRTDGKKWRCSRDVVPGHKYCERHVHRGRGRSRKPVEAAAVTAAAAPTPSAAAASSLGAGGGPGSVHRGAAPPHPHPHGLGLSSPTSVLLAHSAARAT